jgi:hypothetical protein
MHPANNSLPSIYESIHGRQFQLTENFEKPISLSLSPSTPGLSKLNPIEVETKSFFQLWLEHKAGLIYPKNYRNCFSKTWF